jgi:hypothetical protein
MDQANSSARRSLQILLPLVAMCLCGCLAVRIAEERPDGGVVVMPNNSNQWPTYYRNRAEYLMKQKCPDGYVVVQEEEFVDNPLTRDGRKPYEHFEYNGGYERITKYDQKSYRIVFRCGASSGQTASAHKKKDEGAQPKKDSPADELPLPRRLP